MLSFDTYISRKLPLVGLISAVFIIYPNIACLPWDIKFLEGVSCTGFYWYFVYRFFFFWGLIYGAQNEAYMSRSAEKWVRGLCFNELGVCG